MAALLVYTLWLPELLAAEVGQAFMVKLALSGAILIPLGFVMGMPFPTGLRALAPAGNDSAESLASGNPDADPDTPLASDSTTGAVEWAWAMNAASSVLGSVLAIFVAVNLGLTITLACGAAAYLAAWVLAAGWLRPTANGPARGRT